MKIDELSSEPWKPGKQYKVNIATAAHSYDASSDQATIHVHPQQAEFHIEANHFQDAHDKVAAFLPHYHKKFLAHHKPNMRGVHTLGHYATIHDGAEEKEGPHHEVKYVNESHLVSFRQFLVEAPSPLSADAYGKEDNQIRSQYKIPKPRILDRLFDKRKNLGKLGPDHELHYTKNIIGHTYHAYNPKTQRDDMEVRGLHSSGGKLFKVNDLKGREGSTIKAHDFYHHLITKHGITLASSNIQSPGGQKTWQKLSQKPDVKMIHRTAPGVHEPINKDWAKHYEGPGHSQSFFVATKKN